MGGCRAAHQPGAAALHRGLWGGLCTVACGHAGRCVNVCPNTLPPADLISAPGRCREARRVSCQPRGSRRHRTLRHQPTPAPAPICGAAPGSLCTRASFCRYTSLRPRRHSSPLQSSASSCTLPSCGRGGACGAKGRAGTVGGQRGAMSMAGSDGRLPAAAVQGAGAALRAIGDSVRLVRGQYVSASSVPGA